MTPHSKGDDPRVEQMLNDPDRYYGEAWERSRQEVLAERSARPAAAPGGQRTPAMLVPGIVSMSLRGSDEDVERLVTAMRDIGIVVWRTDSTGTRAGNRAHYRYFTVEIPRDADG